MKGLNIDSFLLHLKSLLFKIGIITAFFTASLILVGNQAQAQSKKSEKKLETVKQKKKASTGNPKSKSKKGEANVPNQTTEIRSASSPFRVNRQKSRPSPDSEEKQKIINQKKVKKNQPSSAKGVDYQGNLKTKEKVKSSHKGQSYTGDQPINNRKTPADLNKGGQKSIDDYEPYTPNKTSDIGTKFSGSEKTRTRKSRIEDAKIKSSIMHQHQGDLKAGKKGNTVKGSVYSGSIKTSSQKLKKASSAIIGHYQGNIKASRRGSNNVKGSLYTGSLKAKSPKSKAEDFKILSSIVNEYSGNIKIREKDLKLKGSVYRGNIKGKSSRSKVAYYKNLSAKAHQFQGHIKYKDKDMRGKGTLHMGELVARSQKSKAAYYKKLSTKAHQYSGNVVLKKATKDMHPSAAYKDAKNIKSLDQKEKRRKRSLWWFRNNYDSDQPKSVKQKEKKARHDKKESTIWH